MGTSFLGAFPLVALLPVTLPFFFSRVMAAPKTQGAAPQKEEDGDGSSGGAGVFTYEGEYSTSEVQVVYFPFSPT